MTKPRMVSDKIFLFYLSCQYTKYCTG